MKKGYAESIKKTLSFPGLSDGFKRIVAGILILGIISLMISAFTQFNSRSINLTTEFSSVSESLNPDGSPFNIHEILCDEVMENASAKLKGKFTPEDLKRHLHITQYTSSQDREKLLHNIREGNSEYLSVPTVYKLTFSTISDKISDEGCFSSIIAIFKHVFGPSKKTILNAVTESYLEYYNKNYIQEGNILNVDWTETDGLDYYNKATSSINIAGNISRFISEKNNENPGFVSEKENVGYGELLNEITSFIGFELENYKSFIVQNGLTNDKETLLRQFTYMEDHNEDTNIRMIERYNVIKEAVNFYDSDVTKVVFIPALDNNDSFYMNRTKVGIDYLVEKGKIAKITADDAEHNRINYKHLKTQFENATQPADEAFATADKMYDEIKNKINDFSVRALKIVEEENQNESFLKIKTSDSYIGNGFISMGVFAAKIFIYLLLVAYLFYYLYELIKRKRIIKF